MAIMGFAIMQREILNWEWYDDSGTVHLLLHCNLKANHTDVKWRDVPIKKGQFLTSVESLSRELGQTQQNIKTRLKRLKKANIIDIETTNKYSIITLLIQGGYDNLENETNKQTNKQNNKQTNKQVTSKQQTTNKLLTTDNNEYKEKKEEKEEIRQDKRAGLSLNNYILEYYSRVSNHFPELLDEESHRRLMDEYGEEILKDALNDFNAKDDIYISKCKNLAKVLNGFAKQYLIKLKEKENGQTRNQPKMPDLRFMGIS